MKKTQPDQSDIQETVDLPPTEPEPTDGGKTRREQAVKAARETGEMPPEPPTEDSAELGFAAGESAGDTLPVQGPGVQEATERPEAGAATLEAAPSGDGGGTLSFSLQSDPDDTERTLPPGAEQPERIRPNVAGYEILGVLGEGGMGIVFKAKQARLGRFVALKMIRAGAGARPQDLARFEAEAQAVAAIEHPNIVRIFEIGEHGGMPFCSLEYLSGGSLAKVIGGKPQPPAEAARIVATLAGAMDVTHKRGIIHRDLKPANVLIAHDGTLKVTDFGLVKRLEDDSSRTRTGAILGTPSYMSPEQANGQTHQIGPPADQYALGAILYELLTGRPPFQGTSVLDTLEQVRRKEPVPPSQLQTKIPRDLETICLKALEKDPARRYADVAAMAEDLRRFTAKEPIVARPVSRAERLWRSCVRNPLVAALSAAAVVLLLAGAVGGTSFGVVINQKNLDLTKTNAALGEANVALEEAKNLAEQRRILAESKQKLAEQAAWAANDQNRNSVDAEMALLSLLEDKLRYVPALEEVRKEVLDRTIANLDAAARSMTSLRKEIGWDPKAEENNWKSLARAHQRLAELSLSNNRFKDALEQLKRMDSLIETRAKDNPGDLERQIRLAKSRRQLGFIAIKHLGDAKLATDYFRQAIEIDRACLEKEPEKDNFKIDLANSLGQIAMTEMQSGHLEAARDLFVEEEEVRKSFSPVFAGIDEVRRQLAGMHEQVGNLKIRMNQPEEGWRSYDRSAEIRKQILAKRPGDWPCVYDLALSYNNAAFVRYPQGREPAAARAFHRKALDLIEERLKTDPANHDTKDLLAKTLYYDATCALHSDDRSGAAAEYRRCLEIRKTMVTEQTAKVPQVDLMLALARCGEHAEAARIAAALAVMPPTNENFYIQAACGYAIAKSCAANDKTLAEQYASAAIACLRKAKQAGWSDANTLEIDPDLEAIRNDPRFVALLEEFKLAAQKRP
jgi:eukaryotic-like serine/threonine-protein kinase